ncbi:hypothetical protein EPUS_02542 [Endocarpon pusillum Z07020]|uniref:Heterokaryon incompatibility domain-containing protein n=1 Tax=Endocarpon pusillum (strain Z07020 / HMAS-L-300199) TaxID=1263415 RepID=U1GG07_ENDPU|nr:uncharacterized protein EPUS_02542 [Endocarpon pusillum Z07020]ERF70676.1 hypothetical protein EPUS_02542 [Endocarpon pusillum Z07020]
MVAAEQEADEVANSYRYGSVPTRGIRLLEIPEISIDKPWPLNAYDLQDCPTYFALSYTWGPPLDTAKSRAEYGGVKRPLTLRTGNHSGRLSIELNLFEALEQLIAAGYTGRLWIDAICINQQDKLERSSQVALMGHIYSGCTRALVWLGRDTSNLGHFSWFHETLLPALEKHLDEGGLVSDFFQVVKMANSGEDTTARWRGYVLFYEQRRWFHRCWVMQEVALPPHVSMLCGSAYLDLEEICDLAMFLNDVASAVVPADWQLDHPGTELLTSHKVYAIGLRRVVCRLKDLRSIEWIPSVTGARNPCEMCVALFLSLLSGMRGYQATDPRDKVYAALGMATKFLPEGEDALMTPDYSLSVSEVYRRFAAFEIVKLPYVAVLSYVEDKSIRLLSDLPSWVPDFSPDIVGSAYASRFHDYPFNACVSESVGRYPRSITGHTLQLYGGYFDTVTTVVQGTDSYRQRTQPSLLAMEIRCLEICSQLLEFCSSLESRYVNGQRRLEALSSTLILQQIDGRPHSTETSQMFRYWLLAMLSVSWASLRLAPEAEPLFQKCCKALQNLEEAQDGTLPSEGGIVDYSRMHLTREVNVLERVPSDALPEDIPPRTVKNNVWDNYRLYDRGLHKGLFLGQRLCKTSTGCIGLGPPSMRPGDQVHFICDATVPFVLRPEPVVSRFTLMGETYLHGFMNGEVLRTDFKDRIEPVHLV